MPRSPHGSQSLTRLAIIGACAVMLGACDSGPYGLIVELRTDFEPGLEVVTAETEVMLDASGTVRPRMTVMSTPLARGADLVAGLRIAEYDDVPFGTHTVRVRLRDGGGRMVAVRNLLVLVDRRTAVVVLMTRNCSGVSCPGGGDAEENTECLDGRCVPPSCRPEDPATCGDPTCMDDSDCPRMDCAAGACVSGTCFVDWNDDNCGAGMRCTAASGCVVDTVDAGMRDAGVGVDAGPGVDAGMGVDAGPPTCDVASCDDGIACIQEMCLSSTCMNVPNNALCDDGNACTIDVCGAGGCTNTPDNSLCNDGVGCTDDACGAGGCTNNPIDARCDDGVDCTDDGCNGNGCVHNQINSRCNDGNSCTDDDCTAGGCVNNDNNDPCDDGRFCNGTDRCSGGGCNQHAGNPCDVGAGESCSE